MNFPFVFIGSGLDADEYFQRFIGILNVQLKPSVARIQEMQNNHVSDDLERQDRFSTHIRHLMLKPMLPQGNTVRYQVVAYMPNLNDELRTFDTGVLSIMHLTRFQTKVDFLIVEKTLEREINWIWNLLFEQLLKDDSMQVSKRNKKKYERRLKIKRKANDVGEIEDTLPELANEFDKTITTIKSDLKEMGLYTIGQRDYKG